MGGKRKKKVNEDGETVIEDKYGFGTAVVPKKDAEPEPTATAPEGAEEPFVPPKRRARKKASDKKTEEPTEKFKVGGKKGTGKFK